MSRGRKKLPQAVLDLRGTARKDRQREAVTVSNEKIDKWDIRCWTVPGYEVLNDRARRIFAKRCRTCIALGMLETSYLTQLVMYARECDFYLSCCEDVAKRGRTYEVEDKVGNVRLVDNPSVKMANQALINVRSLGSNFGFSPVDRQKIRVDATDDPMKKIMNIMAQDVDTLDDGEDA